MGFTVPGSEFFANRPIAADLLRSRISPKLALHDVSQESIDSVDALTYEVIRHRLWSITDEMGEALKRMSGSIIVTDANDFDFALCDELGQSVQVGLYNTQLVASMDMAISWTLQHRSENPRITDGDVFLCNDPWVGGGLHQNDTAIYAPVFWEGKLFCWSSAVAHQIDLGGISPGSWTPKSRDVFHESLPTPPVKIVRGGELQRDIEDLWLRRSRMPKLVALDLRAMIGANRIAQERILALVRKYGPDLVKAVMKRMMNDAEARLRAKLREIPDGSWNGVTYQEEAFEGDRGLYKIVLNLSKNGDHLVFDFTGTDKQAGMLNCTYGGLLGGIVAVLLPMLAGDIPWAAGGLRRCFDVISEEGTLNNATFPAGVCKGSIASAWATSDVVTECLAKMIEHSPQNQVTAMAVPCGTWDVGVVAGLDQRNNPFVSIFLEPMAAGFGASVNRDGVDTGGLTIIPMGHAPDAEINEFTMPVLYLWRREEADSGGPGQFRGGLSGSICVIPHDTDVPMYAVISGSGKAVPMNVGLSGGYPGNTQHDVIVRNGDVRASLAAGTIPQRIEDIHGAHEILPSETETIISTNDVYFMKWQGGGGYGDPLLRDPQHVAQDVLDGKVTSTTAHEIYGVVLNDNEKLKEVDASATVQRREQVRQLRRERVMDTVR